MCPKKALQQIVLKQYCDEDDDLESLYEEEEYLSPNTIFCIREESDIKDNLDMKEFSNSQESCQMMQYDSTNQVILTLDRNSKPLFMHRRLCSNH